MNFFSKQGLKTKQLDNEHNICPVCGGRGEILNYNHYDADRSIWERYVICDKCFGIGTIREDNCKAERSP